MNGFRHDRLGARGFEAQDDLPIGMATTAAADDPPVRWDVQFLVPSVHLVTTQQVEWLMPPPLQVNPVEYAEGRLMVFIAGADPMYRDQIAALAPGTPVTCVVWHLGTELARVTWSTPEPEASQR